MSLMGNINYTRFRTIDDKNVFLKTDTEGDMNRGAANLFRNLTTENAPFLRQPQGLGGRKGGEKAT